jgi:aldose 1-epimerase
MRDKFDILKRGGTLFRDLYNLSRGAKMCLGKSKNMRDGRVSRAKMLAAGGILAVLTGSWWNCVAEAQTISESPRVGGAEVVRLLRKATTKESKPEFLSVTLFPGRGMNLFQLTANLPGKGEVELLKSPSIAEAAAKLNGEGDDAYGNLNHSFGAAFLIPFSSRISGTVSSDGKTVTTNWHGKTITLPDDFMGKYAVHGFVNELKAEDLHTINTADGQTVTGVIHAGSFGGHWLSETDLKFTVALTGGAVDVMVTAKNVGKEEEPMAIGWHPYLAIPSGDRSQARVHVPAATIARLDTNDGLTTGELDTVEGTAFDFRAVGGRVLDASLNNNFSHLTRMNGVVDAWLEDPKWNYGIRVAGLSPEIKTVHVYSPKNNTFVAIEEQFNFQDPFGREWKGMDTGMVALQPGESVTWRVRLELFTPK